MAPNSTGTATPGAAPKPITSASDGGQAEADADDALAARGVGGQEAAHQHAAGAGHHVDREADRHQRHRHRVQVAGRLPARRSAPR